jgi:hypothetical protein
MSAVVLGFLSVRALVPGGRRWCRHDCFRLIFGIGLGTGLCSMCYFLGLLWGISGFIVEVVLLLVAGADVVARWKRAVCPLCPDSVKTTPSGTLNRVLVGLLALLLLLDAMAFAIAARREPDGGWDAIAIWNLRARFLYRGGTDGWRGGFSETLAQTHPDYPLLLPAFIARTWHLAGRETRAVPIAVSCLFSFGTVGLAVASVSILRGVRQGLLAGLVLAATPALYLQGMQYADVPLAFFVLATVTALAMADHAEVPGFAVLAGCAAALSAWAKNEGLLWFLAITLSLLIVNRGRRIPAFLAGAAPVLATIVLFKMRVAASSYIFGPAGRVGMGDRLVDLTRYELIVRAVISHVWTFGPLLLSPFLILAAYGALAGFAIRDKHRGTLRATTLALILMVGGEFLVYVLDPLDLAWLLRTSLDRVLMQLWPLAVSLVFLTVRTLEEQPLKSQPAIPFSRTGAVGAK